MQIWVGIYASPLYKLDFCIHIFFSLVYQFIQWFINTVWTQIFLLYLESEILSYFISHIIPSSVREPCKGSCVSWESPCEGSFVLRNSLLRALLRCFILVLPTHPRLGHFSKEASFSVTKELAPGAKIWALDTPLLWLDSHCFYDEHIFNLTFEAPTYT